jgi:hypothetical protein
MSLDSEIRHGLEDATDRVAPSVEQALGEVLRRSRRGQFRRRIAAGVAVVAVMIAAVVAVGLARTQDERALCRSPDRWAQRHSRDAAPQRRGGGVSFDTTWMARTASPSRGNAPRATCVRQR